MSDSTRSEDAAELCGDNIQILADALNSRYLESREDHLLFEPTDNSTFRRREVAISMIAARQILAAISRGAKRLEDYEGWIDPELGYAEFEMRQHSTLNAFSTRSIEQRKFEVHPCSHTHSSNPPLENCGDRVYSVIRVTSKDGSTCLEISRNTALCVPLLSLKDAQESGGVQITLKVFLGGSTEERELVQKSLDLANSFLFELNARHRSPYSLRPRMDRARNYSRLRTVDQKVRFPKTAVPSNIAALFSIPSDFSLRGNRTLAYLSYYQVIESYLPTVHKRDTLKKLRRVLRALDFDEEKDSSVVKLLATVERAHGASDGEQLRTAIEECVPSEKLHEFYSLNPDHFKKGGPISGVPAINPKSGESLASQTAKRVYALRNRIVHAKDDPRFGESKVLLPMSHEAYLLQPDVELVRLLAIEVIVDNG
ncbi:hypothetical protein [Streptomyces alkaliterrae]|uniref:Uncharacterized protein n=1 Tax=Streptomyces alkaliterrae TaxID=2213162 RepID=A0A5P0YN41_9ACTN|nr:hypothetical protein [Streptomyces alkaliterrae]MBB1259387.1 hypothetical protein [Streptomyces alkaliterrae]MQS01764.1 hypothetical protein [Streptomyces alkaliterrae]